MKPAARVHHPRVAEFVKPSLLKERVQRQCRFLLAGIAVQVHKERSYELGVSRAALLVECGDCIEAVVVQFMPSVYLSNDVSKVVCIEVLLLFCEFYRAI